MTKRMIKLLLLCLVMLTGCQNDVSEQTTYTIQVMSEGEKPLSDIKVYVYKNHKQEELVGGATTDEEGLITFEAVKSDEYVAVLQNVPDDYEVEESYSIKKTEAKLKLKRNLVDDEDLTNRIYELGDVVHDFEVTATNGTTYKLSELLKEKKAVILNFWFLNCGPCKMEFPFLEQAYEEYADKIEVIAINPVDGTTDKIINYAQENGLTFPMAVGDSTWQTWMKLEAYPTTIVIDRSGTISMSHKGMITEKEPFMKMFEYFSSDDYEQSIIKKIEDIN